MNQNNSKKYKLYSYIVVIIIICFYFFFLVLLKNKAFSQDVFTIGFSPFQEGRLITSGIGHIRFWKMEQTFTGLKLKGFKKKFDIN
jgi:hypothetical protein